MAEGSKKPKWLKKIRKLLKSQAAADRIELKATLEKLKFKANDLKERIDQAETEDERDLLLQKLALVNKHRKKGMKKLLADDDKPAN